MVLVISAPSGTGKTTLCHMLIDKVENAVFSVSTTSRNPRDGEEQGRDYNFVTEEKFMEMVKKERLLEWAEVHGNYYGTSRELVLENISKGNHVILDIDVQGGIQIKEKLPESILIFLMPPSIDELKRRLKSRNQDSDIEIEKRMNTAQKEIEYAKKYDYLVINDEIDRALKKLESIITAEKCRIRVH
ncbi:MAG: guanylate kinase [Elusimicrobiota bacterium]